MWTSLRSSLKNVRPLGIVKRIVGGIAAAWLIFWFFVGITGFVANLVKYRAQYFPKDINPKYNKDLPPEPLIATSYWEIADRTKWIEGNPGLVRGLATVSCSFLFVGFLHAMDKLGMPVPKDSAFVILFWLVVIPFNVLSIRAITTPVLLPFFDIPLAADTLLTTSEKSYPWQLYVLPGVIPLTLLQSTWIKLIFPRVRDRILDRVPQWEWRCGTKRYGLDLSMRKVVEVALVLVDVAVMNPMDVVAVRLALMDGDKAGMWMVEEPVLDLRTGKAPYRGIWDCVRCIVEEEGVETLSRGWELSVLARLTSVLKVKKDASEVSSINAKVRDEEVLVDEKVSRGE